MRAARWTVLFPGAEQASSTFKKLLENASNIIRLNLLASLVRTTMLQELLVLFFIKKALCNWYGQEIAAQDHTRKMGEICNLETTSQ